MAWKIDSPVRQRLGLVLAMIRNEQAVAALCREAGVSRQTAYKFRRRYEACGRAGSLCCVQLLRQPLADCPHLHPDSAECSRTKVAHLCEMYACALGPRSAMGILYVGTLRCGACFAKYSLEALKACLNL